MTVIYRVYRLNDNCESTIGALTKENGLFCYTLEDEYRKKKVKGDTRILEGVYQIKFREELSPKTKAYRSRHNWFTWHLELQDVPDFKNVYIHYGNDDDDTDGCILVGDVLNNNSIKDGFIGESRNAFQRLYLDMKNHLNKGVVFLSIHDNTFGNINK